MSGIRFASPTNAGKRGADLERLREALVAPPVYEAKNPISDHLWTAIWFPVADLTARQYVNRNMEREFECFSYYCDDPYVHAYCEAHGDSYMATLSIQFVRRLVKVCNRLAPALGRRPRSQKRPAHNGPALERDPILASLIEGDAEVSEAEALANRLLFFNVACCVFAVIWSRTEQRYSSRMTYYPPFQTSHPSAALRYMRFRDFERHLATQYSRSAPMLSPLVDLWSFHFLNTLASVNQHFHDLRDETPAGFTTPTMERLDAYQARLLEVGGALQPYLTAFGFDPSYDPAQDKMA